MDFSSLVLMEKDKETGYITRELGSFEVNEGALYIKKLFVIEDEVNLYFDTNKDVEEWEYSAIYDLFNKNAFEEVGFRIDEDLEEYNPTFIVKFQYSDKREEMKETIDKVVGIIEEQMTNVFKAISGREEEYKE
ncbi:hypothetical protein NNC19_00605 [Clostridium sp. SHJSY1]|uniref:DUF6762 family protein n=1 Tax=Clostridium sp. SHJSY1 TaxID=2942483 RepID=UPI0028770A0B|nr:DUF6762 family protein [Clostridium sp. SHJSY1]MDS0524155.1 hypothetical protein [Clostridium sp. SHJSY1]